MLGYSQKNSELEKNEIIEQINILTEREGQLIDEYQRTIKKVG